MKVEMLVARMDHKMVEQWVRAKIDEKAAKKVESKVGWLESVTGVRMAVGMVELMAF